jgi:oligopeptide/dipeptide ABC transporter ATP-binding protein
VTHDIAALPGLVDRIAVMYLGRLVEIGPADDLLRKPKHPYTRGLLACVPRLDKRIAVAPIPGEAPPGPAAVSGCKFHPRCELCLDRCRSEEPELRQIEPDRKVACHVI